MSFPLPQGGGIVHQGRDKPMKKEWVIQRNQEMEEQFKEQKQKISGKIKTACVFYPALQKSLLNLINSLKRTDPVGLSLAQGEMKATITTAIARETSAAKRPKLQGALEQIGALDMSNLLHYQTDYAAFLDSEPHVYSGDLIITDPSYIIRETDEEDWENCDYGHNLKALGLSNSITSKTLCGDWGCTVFDLGTMESIGHFRADVGLVSVMDLEQVLAYNPKFDWHKTKDFATAWIRDFKGAVWIWIDREEEEGEETFTVHVCGNGVHRSTGEPFKFMTMQTD